MFALKSENHLKMGPHWLNTGSFTDPRGLETCAIHISKDGTSTSRVTSTTSTAEDEAEASMQGGSRNWVLH
jgi:hypothetical protein